MNVHRIPFMIIKWTIQELMNWSFFSIPLFLSAFSWSIAISEININSTIHAILSWKVSVPNRFYIARHFLYVIMWNQFTAQRFGVRCVSLVHNFWVGAHLVELIFISPPNETKYLLFTLKQCLYTHFIISFISDITINKT